MGATLGLRNKPYMVMPKSDASLDDDSAQEVFSFVHEADSLVDTRSMSTQTSWNHVSSETQRRPSVKNCADIGDAGCTVSLERIRTTVTLHFRRQKPSFSRHESRLVY